MSSYANTCPVSGAVSAGSVGPKSVRVPKSSGGRSCVGAAIHNDSLSGQKMSVIVVQAEETEDQKVIGALGCASNEFSIGLIGDFELLGTSRP